MKIHRHIAMLSLAVAILSFCGCSQSKSAAPFAPTPPLGSVPRNIILLIGDGMGPQQVRAASLYNSGLDESLTLQTLPYSVAIATDSDSGTTDSAAAATAIATGHIVKNGVLSMSIPGDGSRLKTILEQMTQAGKRTGIVTTVTVEHATPAGFASHKSGRNSYAEIALDYLELSRPNLIMGGMTVDGKTKKPIAMTKESAQKAGYTVATDAKELAAINVKSVDHVAGLFGQGYMPYESDFATGKDDDYNRLPHLSQMARFALKFLDQGNNGFFLMIEAGKIDQACHANNIEQAIGETLEFDRTVAAVLDWAKDRNDTLVIVMADHETGGLSIVKNNGKGKIPDVKWDRKDHTATKIVARSWGAGASAIINAKHHTDIHLMMAGRLSAATTSPATQN